MIDARPASDLERAAAKRMNRALPRMTWVALALAGAAALSGCGAHKASVTLNLEFCEIRSPVDGKTGPIQVQTGNMIFSSATTLLARFP